MGQSWVTSGMPGQWVSFDPTITGFSSSPANGQYYYMKMGKFVVVTIRQPTNGTSNATTFTISLTHVAVTRANASWVGYAQVVDNGAVPTNPGILEILSGGATIAAYKDFAGNAWTNSGNKRIAQGTIIYETAS